MPHPLGWTPAGGYGSERADNARNLACRLLGREERAVCHEARDARRKEPTELRGRVKRPRGIDVAAALKVRAYRKEPAVAVLEEVTSSAQLTGRTVMEAVARRLKNAVFAGHGLRTSAHDEAAGYRGHASQGADLLKRELRREPKAHGAGRLEGSESALVMNGNTGPDLRGRTSLNCERQLTHIAHRTGLASPDKRVQTPVVSFAAYLVEPGDEGSVRRPWSTIRLCFSEGVRRDVHACGPRPTRGVGNLWRRYEGTDLDLTDRHRLSATRLLAREAQLQRDIIAIGCVGEVPPTHYSRIGLQYLSLEQFTGL